MTQQDLGNGSTQAQESLPSEKDQFLSIQDKFMDQELVNGKVFLVDYNQDNMRLSLRRNSYEKASFVRSAFSLG